MEKLLGPLFGTVAFFYAMAGHGGASGYLALGSMAGLGPTALKGQALALNLLVAGFSAWSFTRAGFLRPKILLPLILFSVPAAYWGARLTLPPSWVKILLGFCLSVAALRLALHPWLVRRAQHTAARPPSTPKLSGLGLGLGVLSGLTGVGGGIYLSPVLILTGWADLKETAAISAWFIWLNSAAGLYGMAKGSGIPTIPMSWILMAGLGGFLGARVGAYQVGAPRLRQVLAGVLVLAAFKLVWAGWQGL